MNYYCTQATAFGESIMQYRQLLTFITTAKTKNMAQTAQILSYSHSTIYSHLEALEREFNAKFYTRTAHGIDLTEQGEVFLKYASQIVDIYTEALAVLGMNTQSEIHVVASEAADVCLIRHMLHKYIEKVPQVDLDYNKTTIDAALTRMAVGTCDLAILSEFNYEPVDLYGQYIGTIPLLFVCSPTCLAQYFGNKNEPPIFLGTMKKDVVVRVMRQFDLDFNDFFSNMRAIGDLDTLKQQLEYNTRSVGLLPQLFAQKELDEGRLVRIPALMCEVDLDAYIVAPSKGKIGPYTQELIDLLFDLYNPQRLTHDNYIRA